MQMCLVLSHDLEAGWRTDLGTSDELENQEACAKRR
jgi:hypothetical protein